MYYVLCMSVTQMVAKLLNAYIINLSCYSSISLSVHHHRDRLAQQFWYELIKFILQSMGNKKEKLIRLKKLSKIYKDAGEEVIALDDANLEVNYGEDLVIVGPSGSGKTTLLQLIGTLDKPSSGEVWIDGKLTTKESDQWLSAFRNQTIGFIFQMIYLYPWSLSKRPFSPLDQPKSQLE